MARSIFRKVTAALSWCPTSKPTTAPTDGVVALEGSSIQSIERAIPPYASTTLPLPNVSANSTLLLGAPTLSYQKMKTTVSSIFTSTTTFALGKAIDLSMARALCLQETSALSRFIKLTRSSRSICARTHPWESKTSRHVLEGSYFEKSLFTANGHHLHRCRRHDRSYQFFTAINECAKERRYLPFGTIQTPGKKRHRIRHLGRKWP